MNAPSIARRLALLVSLSFAVVPLAACTGASGGDNGDLVGADEPDDGTDGRATESVVGGVTVGEELKTNAALNLRTGPGKTYRILQVIPQGALVTVVSATPKNGWYNIRHNGTDGWSYGIYLDKVGSTGGGVTGLASCNPARAVGVVSADQKALLDLIGYTEGTAGHGEDGYNVTFAYHYFDDCNHHPDLDICSGGYCSTAAGRYQFLYTTWTGLHLPNFRPENQTLGAMKLISYRGASIPSGRPLTATEFVDVMNKISWEWASLPPGRYGQPSKTMNEARTKYCSLAHC
jgi:muramidase (phage lysozyme)